MRGWCEGGGRGTRDERTRDERRGTKDEGRETRDEGRKTKDEGRKTIVAEEIKSVRDLKVYRLAFETAMEIFEISKVFPSGEKYSLTDQIRRASRSVCTNLSEGWRKRRYKAVFVNKLTDAQQEAGETQTWLEFALACGYINQKHFDDLDEKYEHIFAQLITMERKADSFCKDKVRERSERSPIVLESGANGRPSS